MLVIIVNRMKNFKSQIFKIVQLYVPVSQMTSEKLFIISMKAKNSVHMVVIE